MCLEQIHQDSVKKNTLAGLFGHHPLAKDYLQGVLHFDTLAVEVQDTMYVVMS